MTNNLEFKVETIKYDEPHKRYRLIMIVDGKPFACEHQYKTAASCYNQRKRILEGLGK